MKQGPNVKRLIIEKMSCDAVPSGGGVADVVKFLTTPGALTAGAKQATQFIELAIRAVREAAEPNPWKDADDEAIAGEVLRQMRERKAKKAVSG